MAYSKKAGICEISFRHGQKKVSKIVDESGFENLTHFSRIFKEKYGLSPIYYRKKTNDYNISNPGKDICGKGKHTHAPHLSILLTDAKVTVTALDGKTQIFGLTAGTTFWSETETHIAINSGSKIAKAYLVELK